MPAERPDESPQKATDAPASEPAAAPCAEAAALVAWLESLAEAPERLLDLDPALHRRLRLAAGRLARPDAEERRRLARARRRARARATRERDDAALEATSNRARKRALAFPVPPATTPLDPADRALLERQARTRPRDEGARRLHRPRACYVCKAAFRELHPHYDALCPPCAALNWRKRHQTADLTGRVALVTGARVKIGYEAALMLLRAGARVIATTRFVCDAARRFEGEPDFDAWRERLVLRAIDLRHTPAVEAFCAALLAEETRLDFLIHNACQTVRRPPAWYAEKVEAEAPETLSQRARSLLAAPGEAPRRRLDGGGEGEGGKKADAGRALALAPPDPGSVARASLLDLLGEAELAPLFPPAVRDGEGQPLDLRASNSWRMELADVPTVELLEVHLVNAVAPFVLNARLKPLLLAAPGRDQHVVHVSAMEGQFDRRLKTTRHPHTNMAKAALNMLTRTSAADFARDGIHMNSVDTGWVTDEDPFAKTVEKEETQRFAPPLDAIDGAARVLDPIFTGLTTGRHCWGQFLKDYAPAPW